MSYTADTSAGGECDKVLWAVFLKFMMSVDFPLPSLGVTIVTILRVPPQFWALVIFKSFCNRLALGRCRVFADIAVKIDAQSTNLVILGNIRFVCVVDCFHQCVSCTKSLMIRI